MLYSIKYRIKQEVNTDPEHRCYDGCYFSSEMQWTEWEYLESGILDIAKRLKFWQELNDYAVKERGKLAKREFKAFDDKGVEITI